MMIFQVSAIEARPSLVTQMLEKDKSSISNPPNKITITINVDDDNDNSPKFSPSKMFFESFYVVISCFRNIKSPSIIILTLTRLYSSKFLADNYVFNFPTSGIRKGAPIGNVLARDADQGLNSLIRYRNIWYFSISCLLAQYLLYQ